MLSGEWDSYALEREQEERIQKRMFQKEKEKGNSEYINSVFGDLIEKKSSEKKVSSQGSIIPNQPTTPISSIKVSESVAAEKGIVKNPDVSFLTKKDEAPKAIYKSSEIELLKMRASGDIDHRRLSAIIENLM